MSALASLERFEEKDAFFKNEDRAVTVQKVNGLQCEQILQIGPNETVCFFLNKVKKLSEDILKFQKFIIETLMADDETCVFDLKEKQA